MTASTLTNPADSPPATLANPAPEMSRDTLSTQNPASAEISPEEREALKRARRAERRLKARAVETAIRATTGADAAPVAPVAPESVSRLATLALATKRDALALKAEREREGVSGREETTEWTAQRRAAFLAALEGATVRFVVSHVETYATKRGDRARLLLVAIVTVDTAYGRETACLRGDGITLDVADASRKALDGITLDVKLQDAGETRKGELRTGLRGVAVGLASSGARVGIKATFYASRYAPRFVASAL